ncbi:HAD-IIIA family hydrolase [Thomasclavelia ramosa]|uniref:HAD-IIIA family hydrolase n=1 Tax=Thomasclavelia ramosa TaxID=1547 RepID=UPI00214B3CF2|nr:HAD-IIIA family hydrolase [Thomasclavelia ramosa]MCR1948279.1 HAD-IIIA family hydrolase [Thomasclavelia ramosa]MCR1958986.1 HAD-IIIA family hydrolase [Thomasclavelia ramosa]
MNDYYSFAGKLLTILQNNGINVLNIYYCPHNDLDHCCKKPKPGMIEKALKEYDMDMQSSIYYGDSQADYLLAKHFGLTFYGINYSGKENDVRKCNSLLDVCKYIG